MLNRIVLYQVRQSVRGFTLIELLVTIILVSVGMLGLSKLQLTSLRYNQNSYQRSIATLLAYDMANRMRANASAAKTGAYHLVTPVQTTGCLSISGCTSAEMAANDAYEWLSVSSPTSVVNQLPDSSATICLDSTPDDGDPATYECDGLGSQYAIKIWWSSDAGVTIHRFVTSIQI